MERNSFITSFIAGVAAGAALTFILDPSSGRRRRALLRDQFVRAGDKLGAIIPDGGLRAIAEFAPSSALGRIQTGQRARFRLDGFPWTEYGQLEATVSRVASEPRQGVVRVELIVHPESAPPPRWWAF